MRLSKDQGEELADVNFVEERKEAPVIFISSSLSIDLRKVLLTQSTEWRVLKMPGLDLKLLKHQLNIKEEPRQVE